MYQKLKEKREKKGYTIRDMAKVIDMSEANYWKKENGQVKFSVAEALNIADFLETTVEKIFLKIDLQ